MKVISQKLDHDINIQGRSNWHERRSFSQENSQFCKERHTLPKCTFILFFFALVSCTTQPSLWQTLDKTDEEMRQGNYAHAEAIYRGATIRLQNEPGFASRYTETLIRHAISLDRLGRLAESEASVRKAAIIAATSSDVDFAYQTDRKQSLVFELTRHSKGILPQERKIALENIIDNTFSANHSSIALATNESLQRAEIRKRQDEADYARKVERDRRELSASMAMLSATTQQRQVNRIQKHDSNTSSESTGGECKNGDPSCAIRGCNRSGGKAITYRNTAGCGVVSCRFADTKNDWSSVYNNIPGSGCVGSTK